MKYIFCYSYICLYPTETCFGKGSEKYNYYKIRKRRRNVKKQKRKGKTIGMKNKEKGMRRSRRKQMKRGPKNDKNKERAKEEEEG